MTTYWKTFEGEKRLLYTCECKWCLLHAVFNLVCKPLISKYEWNSHFQPKSMKVRLCTWWNTWRSLQFALRAGMLRVSWELEKLHLPVSTSVAWPMPPVPRSQAQIKLGKGSPPSTSDYPCRFCFCVTPLPRCLLVSWQKHYHHRWFSRFQSSSWSVGATFWNLQRPFLHSSANVTRPDSRLFTCGATTGRLSLGCFLLS